MESAFATTAVKSALPYRPADHTYTARLQRTHIMQSELGS